MSSAVEKTTKNSTNKSPVFKDGPGVTVKIDIKAQPEDIWPYLIDINFPSKFSTEFQGAEWIDAGPKIGAKFQGYNKHDRIGEWDVTCHVVRYEENKAFGWVVGNPEVPAAQWYFELESLTTSTRLKFIMVLGPGPSGLTRAIESVPEKESRIIEKRQDEHSANMSLTLEGLKQLVENS